MIYLIEAVNLSGFCYEVKWDKETGEVFYKSKDSGTPWERYLPSIKSEEALRNSVLRGLKIIKFEPENGQPVFEGLS